MGSCEPGSRSDEALLEELADLIRWARHAAKGDVAGRSGKGAVGRAQWDRAARRFHEICRQLEARWQPGRDAGGSSGARPTDF